MLVGQLTLTEECTVALPSMCGIVGFIDPSVPARDGVVRQMAGMIAHRGPDGEGYFVDNYVALGMRRLAVIDINGGDQPKCADNGEIQMVYNGELYNYLTLRKQLRALGRKFESDSDTEVVANAFAEWRLDAFRRFDGMFAIAIWDRRSRELILARDRFGEKPLYVWARPHGLAFASEPRAFCAIEPLPDIDVDALSEYLHLGYISCPRTIWQRISKVRPGEYMVVKDGSIRRSQYWAIEPTESSYRDRHAMRDAAASLLDQAVHSRLVADVNIGVLLSGGVDSSLVTLYAAKHLPQVKTFTVAFIGTDKNEGPFAARTAEVAGAEHHELEVTGSDALKLVPDLGHIYDEPFADSSAIPTVLISRFANTSVKVVLGGDGGDELFSGYKRYRQMRLLRHVQGLSRSGAMVRSRVVPRKYRWIGDLLGKDLAETYRNRLAITSLPTVNSLTSMPGSIDRLTDTIRNRTVSWNASRTARLIDLDSYLPDDLLVKVDRASMSTGLEVRAPFLEPRLATFSMSLESAMLGPAGRKTILREMLAGFGEDLASERPKQGFSIPIREWIPGPLRPLVNDVLSASALAQHGYFNESAVSNTLAKAMQGEGEACHATWSLIMFQLWYEAWMCQRPTPVA